MPAVHRSLACLVLAALIAAASGGCAAATVDHAQSPASSPDAAPTTPTTPTAPPAEVEPSGCGEGQTAGKDPVSGGSQQVDFPWEQLCLSSDYQLQIAKDPEFTIIVLDTGGFHPALATSPRAFYPAGGLAPSPSSLTGWARLEAGQTYYWRVRVVRSATGQYLRSPWSEVKSFTVEP